ncbi:MAG: hypothetical protein II336_14405 [Loktanella sp.]|nr:hypothetical protein [Loktanella sp.]
MTKYLIALGVLIVAVVAYFIFAPATTPPSSESEPVTVAPSVPEPVPAAEAVDDDTRLEQIAADTRENLPSALTDTLTWTDALFLPRMRIMEYSYVSADTDAEPSADNLRNMIATRAETICLDGRDMFEMGTTLRNNFETSNGDLIDRVYLLPEDCLRFY